MVFVKEEGGGTLFWKISTFLKDSMGFVFGDPLINLIVLLLTKNYWLKGLNYKPQKKTIESFENVEIFQKSIPKVHMYLSSNLVYAYLALNNF